MLRTRMIATFLALGAVLASAPARAQQARARADAGAVTPALRDALIQSLERGAAYLRQQQKPDESWENYPGITALAATALLRQTGKTPAQQLPLVDKALAYLAALAKPNGAIYGRDLPHYNTAVAMMAFVASGKPEYRSLIEKARGFLVEEVIDEGEGYTPKDKFYGGLGYGSDQRPDLVNLELALKALKEADLPANHPAWNKAILFIQRTQNFSETNDQEWAANDGGFIYYPGFTYAASGGTSSYGSMSYAGLLSYAYASVKKEDPRVQAALRWIRNNYTVDENPGVGNLTLYYYYLVFAKALQAWGESTIVDAKGRPHNWREDLGKKLIELQHPEGYWVNENPAEWQDNKVLVTSFTMMAIEYILMN